MTLKKNQGFTLVELMVALVIGSFLILGVVGTYSAISTSVQTSKDLETAQEVIRYSSQVFTRSLKQTQGAQTANQGSTMIVQQRANTRSCLGTLINVQYQETFTFVQPDLFCSIQDAAGAELFANTRLLTDIENMTFSGSATLFTITVLPEFLPDNFGNGLEIDIALSSLILQTTAPN